MKNLVCIVMCFMVVIFPVCAEENAHTGEISEAKQKDIVKAVTDKNVREGVIKGRVSFHKTTYYKTIEE